MAWYFYYQETPESKWNLADASLRQEIVEKQKPPFVTALDLDTILTDESSSEEIQKTKYRGDFYVDFDSEDIAEVCGQFKLFLTKLEKDYEVNLEQVELFASGGKGFHIIFPARLFVQNPNSAGYQNLHLIYKEMAQSLYVNTLDMRVYSGKRGRMFRVAGVERPNGKYKVPISVQEAKAMSPAKYDELTSENRSGFQIQKPEVSPKLALLFTTSRDKVSSRLKARGKFKRDRKLVEKFDGKFPDSFIKLGQGDHIDPEAGFHNIAMQIAIVAHAVGKSLEDTLAVVQPLIDNHSGDGKRYNTAAKRKAEVERMYHYMDENPCYEFSAGALKNLFVKGTETPDLNAVTDDAYGVLDEEEDAELGINDQISKGVRIKKEGMFLKHWNKEEGEYQVIQLSELGLDNVAMLNELESGNTTGFEFDCFVASKPRGRKTVPANTFTSASQVRANLGGLVSATVQVTDAQAVGMMDIMRKMAERSGRVVTALPREGIDVVTHTQKEGPKILYAGPNSEGVWSKDGRQNQYRLMTVNGDDGEFKSDILTAPMLQESDAEFFDHFFKLHPAEVMAPILGYQLASFMNMLIRHAYGQFPMMQVAGQAGAGKTSFNHLVSRLHYYTVYPPVWGANAVTPFALTTLLQSTSSIPILFDEFKRAEMSARRVQEYLLIMRNNYTGNTGGKGKVIKDSGVGRLTIQKNASVAPLIFLTENLETQTAIMDRSVIVQMGAKMMAGDSDSWHICTKHNHLLGQWGRLCVHRVLNMDLDSLSDAIHAQSKRVAASGQRLTARPQFNLAITLLGLQLGQSALASVFGDKFKSHFEYLEESLLDSVGDVAPQSQSEVAKVMTTLAYMSGISNMLFKMEKSEDYELMVDERTGEETVEIHLKNAWDKYSRFRRSQGEEVLMGTEAAFINALTRHATVVDPVCIGSALKKDRPSARVVRFGLDKLYEEGVEEFAQS